MSRPQVRLRRGSRARVLGGHPWVFKGELDDLPPALAAGDTVDLLDTRGGFVGRGLITPSATLCLRLLTRDPAEEIDGGLFLRRIRNALARRRRDLPGEEAFRLAGGEGDGLPGLVVDVYGKHAVVQATTAGMDRRVGEIVTALSESLSPASILARHDIPMRAREGLPMESRQVSGETPREIEAAIGGLRFSVDPWTGHKTGFYLDQRGHYRILRGRCEGKRILDVFCYVGAWTVAAAKAGAKEAVGIDSSAPALERAQRHAEMNGAASARFVEANAFDFLREASDRGERFDGIVLDPPPFVKAKEDLEAGLGAYKELNLRALKMLAPGGWLFSSCCSQRVTRPMFRECLAEAAADAHRPARLLEETGHPPDHPVLLAAPETEYLKGLLLEVA